MIESLGFRHELQEADVGGQVATDTGPVRGGGGQRVGQVGALALTGSWIDRRDASALGLAGGYYQGAQGGTSIAVNTFSFGASDALGVTNSQQYQGWEYTGSRVASTISREALITAATLGTAQVARGGSQTALYTYQGLQGMNAARSGYAIGHGSYRVSQGDNWGFMEIAGGGLSLTGGLTLAASNPTLNSIGGFGQSSSGLTQRFVNWWNMGAEGDAAFQQLTYTDKFKYTVGLKSLPDSEFKLLQNMNAIERGSELLKDPLHAFNPHFKQITSLLNTGPDPATRLYVPWTSLFFGNSSASLSEKP